MAQRHQHPNATERWEREGRDLLLFDQNAVTQGLYCLGSGLQDQVRLALVLVGWTEADYLEAMAHAARAQDTPHG